VVATVTLDPVQQRAVDVPLHESLSIAGAAGTGKSTALRARVDRARAEGYVTPLLAGLDEHPSVRLGQLAFQILGGAGSELRLVDDVEAEKIFEEAAAPLLAMESELLELEIDPEVPGLRSPERFLESAFRLERRLGESAIGADEFLSHALAGATEFYAHPPNLADPRLLAATDDRYRPSLAVSQEELQRQYRREIDLAKLLAQVFRVYRRALDERRAATARDAVAAALELLAKDASVAARMRDTYRVAFIDDVQNLTPAECGLLRGIFGERLDGVTVAGDPSTHFGAGPPARLVDMASARVALKQRYRATVTARVLRPDTQKEEADEIASYVAALLQQGTSPSQIAVLLRSVESAILYSDALLDRDVPVQIAGNYNLFADRRALDALALLWNVHDPYRHEYLLRTLSNRAMNLSDASVAILCGEPVEEQAVLFEELPAKPPSGRQHRDETRAIRLARNVLFGVRDDALPDIARERVERWRALRERWVEEQQRTNFEAFARAVWAQGLAREGEPGSPRARAQQTVLQRLLERLTAFLDAHPGASLGELLADAERRSRSRLEVCESLDDGPAVSIASVESTRGRSFDHVILANVRPGAFPCWYAPDAFFFSMKLGMVPKDNVGDAPTARTAKFLYYVDRIRAKRRYYEHERRIFAYARNRAVRSLLVTAFGRPTRGISAPELLEELRGA
jgi:superfamily I DNA/RNA helicase